MIEPKQAPATKVGRYRILRPLPWGGLSRVYLAIDRPDQRVALRLLRLGDDADTLEQTESLRQGAALQSYLSLTDPRVHRLVEIGEADGYFFTAAEYHEGRTLSELVRQGPLPVRRAAYIAAEVSDIIQRAHALKLTIGEFSADGIVHGDIKPTNITGSYFKSVTAFEALYILEVAGLLGFRERPQIRHLRPGQSQNIVVDVVPPF